MALSVDGEDICIDFDFAGKHTEKAYNIMIDGVTYWLPKSLCRVYDNQKKAWGPEWLFTQKGLI